MKILYLLPLLVGLSLGEDSTNTSATASPSSEVIPSVSEVSEYLKVKLRDITTLNFISGRFNTRLRTTPTEEIKCISGCSKISLNTMRCDNTGFDGRKVHWTCRAPGLPAGNLLENVRVICEGFSGPEDVEYITQGSCRIEFVLNTAGADDESLKVKLRDVTALTFQAGRFATRRRTTPVEQIKCISGCTKTTPNTIRCDNTGFDGLKVQWTCKAPGLPKGTTLDNTKVLCEGFSVPYDFEYITRGSCRVEFVLNTAGAYEESLKVKLRDVTALTFQARRFATRRRTTPVEQIKCISGCTKITPNTIRCYNTGFDGRKWICKVTGLPKGITLDNTRILCEGFSGPEDLEYITQGSCRVEFILNTASTNDVSLKMKLRYVTALTFNAGKFALWTRTSPVENITIMKSLHLLPLLVGLSHDEDSVNTSSSASSSTEVISSASEVSESLKVKLRDITTLNFIAGRFNRRLRTTPMEQIKCISGCSKISPKRVRCDNTGYDGRKVQWTCKAPGLPIGTTLDNTRVICEGFSGPEDFEYINQDSCRAEFVLNSR